MTWSRAVAGRAVDLLSAVAGRHRVVRAARFSLNRARLDVPNRPATNGEYALQRWLMRHVPGRITALDVGANAGAWSQAMLRCAGDSGRAHDLDLHAFEPSGFTAERLRRVLPASAHVNRLAMSDTDGEATMHVAFPGAGTNTLHPGTEGAVLAGTDTETVRTSTVDAYLQRAGIDQVCLLKVDTEGHDFFVLRGAERSFRAGAIAVVQFEYNHRWVHSRRYLKDVFDFLQPFGYRIGKLTPHGMESYDRWDAELETFVEGNYLACSPAFADRLPQVPWWKIA